VPGGGAAAELRSPQKAGARERYANDETYRERQKALRRALWEAKGAEIRASRRYRYATDPEYREKHYAHNLMFNYGLTIEQFRNLLHRQNYACAICERPFDRTPHVDHCHVTHWVRGLLCHRCNPGLGNFQDNPAFLVKAARYMARWLLHVLQLLNRKEHDMTTNDDSGDSKASRMMRKAILHELHQPFGVDPPAPTDHLQAIARALVTKAVAHDVSAIKEILDRVDGKTPSIPTTNDLQQLVNLSWKEPEHPSKKSKSTTARAANSSPATDEPSASPAS
jgi:hypothetical protein